MICPTCNSQNQATDVHCLQCRTLLIETAVKRSDSYSQAAKEVDYRMYGWIGAGGGAALLGLLSQSGGLFLFGGLAGSFIGRLIVWKKWKDM